MKPLLRCLCAISFVVLVANPMPAVAQKVLSASSTSIVVASETGNKSFHLTKETSIVVNGRDAEASDLMVGMTAIITPDDEWPTNAVSIKAKGEERAVYDGEISYRANVDKQKKNKRKDSKGSERKPMFSKISAGTDNTLLGKSTTAIVLSSANEGSQSINIGPQTQYTVNGRRATIDDLTVGMKIDVVMDDASRVAVSVSAKGVGERKSRKSK